jgi:two-component system cell cycle sensor histidine kinase PleC
MNWRQVSAFLWDRNEDERFLRARLDMIAATLPYAAALNPLWVLFSALPLTLAVTSIGKMQWWTWLAAMFALLLSSFMSYRLWKDYSRQRGSRARSMSDWLRSFIALQATIGLSWGAIVLAFWQPGNDVNNAALAIAIIVIITAQTITRTSHLAVYVAGLVPACLIFWLCTLFSPYHLAGYMAVVAPLWFAFIGFVGYLSKRRVDELLSARFANEDMARALEEARDEALKKRFEAETANASKTAFLANMSHELRTPLNAILGFSEIIAGERLGPVGSARYREYGGDIHSSGAHLLNIINDLLDVAKIEAGRMEIEPKQLDARRTLEDAVKFTAPKARERRQIITINVEPNTPPLYADERAIKQIVINLVSNAVKFTPPEGHIDVIARGMPNGDVEITVKDNGPGIPKERLGHVFEPFAQIDNRYDRQQGGTGLGLALVRNLAELHGGTARIESEAGRGTAVSVVLPAHQAQRVAAA